MGIFDNPLANMYGPYFLALYAAFIVTVCIVIYLWKTLSDRSDSLPIPSVPQNIDPFEAAYMRGGQNELARAAVFSLVQRGLVTIDNSGKSPRIRRTAAGNPPMLAGIELDTLDWIGSERGPKDLFSSGGLTTELARHSRNFESRLEHQQLINGQAARAAFAPYQTAAIIAVLGLGVYKFVAAFAHNRLNVGFLIVFVIVGSIAAYYSGKLPHLTKLGRAYLDRLQLAFSSVRSNAETMLSGGNPAAQAGFADVDPLLLSVGVFGTAILAGSMYNDYNDAFRKAQASGSCGASCGGTGSCSSGDGGSGCGGGCGGCGGGD